ncbi:MAG TPA: hypothetical protein VFR27_08715 [Mycobacterium sp.]|nr:hypothetical protein [Mycobacterium sp.]
MADELRVDPEALRLAGNEIAGHGETLYALQRSCHDQAQDAHPGWVGVSAGALSELLDNWSTVGTDHIARIGEHSCDMHYAAAEFTWMTQRHSAAVTAVYNCG